MAESKDVDQIDIPMLPVVPGSLLPTRGRDIRRGAEKDDDDVVHAEHDIQLRESLLLDHGVTAVDTEHAKKRKLAIMMELVNAEHHPGPPAWVAQLREDMAQLRQEMKDGLDASIESVNSNNQRKNFRIFVRPDNLNIPLFAYRNRSRALGGPLPGRPQPAVPPVLPAYGEFIPSPPFPRNMGDVIGFTMDQIEALSMVLNSDFGIVAEDPLEDCRRKMKDYLLFTMV